MLNYIAYRAPAFDRNISGAPEHHCTLGVLVHPDVELNIVPFLKNILPLSITGSRGAIELLGKNYYKPAVILYNRFNTVTLLTELRNKITERYALDDEFPYTPHITLKPFNEEPIVIPHSFQLVHPYLKWGGEKINLF